MWGRDGRRIEIGGDHVVFTPSYGPPFVADLNGGRRYATIEDFRNFVKLTWMSPWLAHGSGTVCEPVDVPVDKRHLDMVDAHLRYSANAAPTSRRPGAASLRRGPQSSRSRRLVLTPLVLEHATRTGPRG